MKGVGSGVLYPEACYVNKGMLFYSCNHRSGSQHHAEWRNRISQMTGTLRCVNEEAPLFTVWATFRQGM